MDFKVPTLEDKPLLDSYFQYCKYRSCDFSSATMLLWKDFFKMTYTLAEDMLIVRSNEGKNGSFSFPIGNGNEKQALLALMKYCKEEDVPFVLHGITEEMEKMLKEMFGDIFIFDYNRDLADYIYEREKLATLSGKKLHGKRNHINRFKENHSWSYEPLSDDNSLETLAMLMEWKLENCNDGDQEKHEEICVAKNSLIYYKELQLTGGVLKCDDKIVAFTVGEPLTLDTYVIHIEKAFSEIQGAYPMINQQFIQHEAMDYTYVNREEDLGEEGLRKAKLSYRPSSLLEKALVKLK